MTIEEARSYGWGERSQAFTDWRNKVDAALVRRCGLSGDDMGDCNYASMFDSGTSPAAAARQVLQENDFYT